MRSLKVRALDDFGLLTPGWITVAYIMVSSLWILFSDRLVSSIAATPAVVTQLQTLKGWLFIMLSGILIYGLTTIYHQAMLHERDKLRATGEKLQVLNRVLRHNIRTEMNIILGNAETANEQIQSASESGECLKEIEETAKRTVELAQKARRISELDLDSESEAIDIRETVEETVQELEDKYPEATIVVDLPESIYAAGNGALKLVLGELVENAIEHNNLPEEGCEVRITASTTLLSTIELEVSDNGPGIPEQEIGPILHGEETPLDHASALGLWMVKWAVEHLDGSLDFENKLDNGATVRITLPMQALPTVHSKVTTRQ